MFEYDEFGNLVPMTSGRGGFALPSRTFGTNYTSNVGSYLGSNPPPQIQQAPLYAGQGYSQPAPAPAPASPQQPLGFGAAEYKGPGTGAAQTVGGILGAAGPAAGALGSVAGVAAKANPYLAAGTLAVGALSTIGGLVGLANTKKPKPYSLDPKIQAAIGESESAARYGLSDTQLAAARQSQSQNVNSAMYNARNTSAGSGSRAVFGALQGMNMNAGNQLAMSDFNAQQGKIRYRDQMYGQIQTIRDRNTAQDIDTYNRKQQAYGGALQSGLTNMSSYFNLGQAMRYNPATTG
jgi:hypothetical protein